MSTASAVSRRVPAWLPFLIAALLIAADQGLKAWALTHLQENAPARPFVPSLLEWQLIFNTGAAWSLFSGSAAPLALGRLLIGVGILLYTAARLQGRLLSTVLSMIAAGAIGNAIDGLRQGKVTDMFHSPLLSSVTQALHAGSFPIFNLADSCVVVGTLVLIVASFFGERRTAPPQPDVDGV